MKEGSTKFIICDTDEGPVCINISQIAYFKNLYGNPDKGKVEIIMNNHFNSRLVVDGTVDGLVSLLEMALR